ncbi:hypothetical protein IWW56_002434 [Coemansia sp. RSA 2131]|nr:hypothetical protein IWW56_002434 [Coemansia sp. RSA 2131]KAJ2658363.1 hypothetical protein IW148_004744 [Coemansia sp. RSA 1199]
MTRIAMPAPKRPVEGTEFVSKPLMLKKSDIEKTKREEAQNKAQKRKQESETGDAAQKRNRSEKAKNKRAEQRRMQRQTEKEKDMTCFLCRKVGHSVKNCPKSETRQNAVCYHCGSDDHTTKRCPTPGKSFPFATCYVCGEQGHLASLCQKNEKGLYPNGGGCKYCSSTQHLAKDCRPTRKNNNTEMTIGTVDARQGGDDDDVFVALHRQQKDVGAQAPVPVAKKPKKTVVNF